MFKKISIPVLVVLVITLCVYYISGIGVLSPSQVDSSMLDTVVKVKGKVTYAVESPMGAGGMYLTLGDSKGEVDVRIRDDIWQSYDEDMKAKFYEGKTATAEGVLFRAGNTLVVVQGIYSLSSDTTSK